MISTILFDLDGTLLPMDQDKFVQSYLRHLAVRFAPLGYDPKALVNAIWEGTAAMVANDSTRTNEQVFWDCFSKFFDRDVVTEKPIFDDFYRTQFQQVAADCGFTPAARQTIDALKAAGYNLVLATNPIFPAIATEGRIRWAGLSPDDFIYYTTYENSTRCKPNPAYYQDILHFIGCQPEECLMVGNDVAEDMVAQALGMEVFLLTDCLINRASTDISIYPHGSFDALMDYLGKLTLEQG